MNNNPSFQDEKNLETRVENVGKTFRELYGRDAEVIVRSPGRAEILGNHTDYNQGFSLAAAISRSILSFAAKRDDDTIRIQSTIFPGEEVVFSLDEIHHDETHFWSNYPRAVLKQLIVEGYEIHGADILVDTDVPKSGGVSSSAAFELAIARSILELYGREYDPLKIALLCQKAENSPIVNSPCGFLDQGTVALGERGKVVFFDFLPSGSSPVSEVKKLNAPLSEQDLSFVIIVDTHVERHLGESGYVARRRMCEESLPFWSTLLERRVTSLREVSVADFELGRDALEAENPVMRKRVEHVVRENDRVLEAVRVLETGDMTRFGELLTESGKSALELYELDEDTPQLTFLVHEITKIDGVVGGRNMGGGFSAIALALVRNSHMKDFEESISQSYKEKFGNTLEFIEFSLTAGTEVLKVNE